MFFFCSIIRREVRGVCARAWVRSKGKQVPELMRVRTLVSHQAVPEALPENRQLKSTATTLLPPSEHSLYAIRRGESSALIPDRPTLAPHRASHTVFPSFLPFFFFLIDRGSGTLKTQGRVASPVVVSFVRHRRGEKKEESFFFCSVFFFFLF